VLVQLEPKGVTLASIAAGGSDAYLRSYADAVVAFGHPVILSFGHEMNGNWYPWGYGHASSAHHRAVTASGSTGTAPFPGPCAGLSALSRRPGQDELRSARSGVHGQFQPAREVTMTGVTYGIVAGYDGSPGSAEAVRWASREAEARDTTLTVCLAWAPDHVELPTESAICDLARQHGKEILARGLPYAQSVLGHARVHAALIGGPAARVLCECSRTAEMVVVGSRGHSELPGLRLGSVAWQLAGHASGRVVIVRGRWRPVNQSPGPVLVGVDGSLASQAALRFAFEEAELRDVPLVVLCALGDAPGVLGGAHAMEERFSQIMTAEEKEHPEVTVLRQVAVGTPRSALLTAAAGAQMLIVGCRGRGGFEGMNLGSAAQAVLHCAPCPVGLVHPPVSQP
jgi:nucleotide-binding universal stress UspA family protein